MWDPCEPRERQPRTWADTCRALSLSLTTVSCSAVWRLGSHNTQLFFLELSRRSCESSRHSQDIWRRSSLLKLHFTHGVAAGQGTDMWNVRQVTAAWCSEVPGNSPPHPGCCSVGDHLVDGPTCETILAANEGRCLENIQTVDEPDRRPRVHFTGRSLAVEHVPYGGAECACTSKGCLRGFKETRLSWPAQVHEEACSAFWRELATLAAVAAEAPCVEATTSQHRSETCTHLQAKGPAVAQRAAVSLQAPPRRNSCTLTVRTCRRDSALRTDQHEWWHKR